MERIAYVNGEFLPLKDARISVLDRGFLMADAVYEVTSVIDGKLVDFAGHIARLHRSLNELDMKTPANDAELLNIHREIIRRNQLGEGAIYLQITRGEAERDFAWPDDITSGIVLFTQEKSLSSNPAADKGISIISIPDLRWGRRDIKTTQLLYPSLGKMMAKKAGADDAWMIEDGAITEGTSNNAYIVKDGAIITRAVSNAILSGITRAAVLRLAEETQLNIEERNFTLEEALVADEAFISSATTFVTPVVQIDGQTIGSGTPGNITKRLREIYIEEARQHAI